MKFMNNIYFVNKMAEKISNLIIFVKILKINGKNFLTSSRPFPLNFMKQ